MFGICVIALVPVRSIVGATELDEQSPCKDWTPRERRRNDETPREQRRDESDYHSLDTSLLYNVKGTFDCGKLLTKHA